MVSAAASLKTKDDSDDEERSRMNISQGLRTMTRNCWRTSHRLFLPCFSSFCEDDEPRYSEPLDSSLARSFFVSHDDEIDTMSGFSPRAGLIQVSRRTLQSANAGYKLY